MKIVLIKKKLLWEKNIDLTWRYVFRKDDDGKLTKPADTPYGYTLWGRGGVVKFNKPINQLDPIIKELLAEVGKDIPEDEDVSAENKKQQSPNTISSIALRDFIILDVFGGDLDFLRNKNNNNDRIQEKFRMEKRRLKEGYTKKALKEAVIDDLDIALYTPGTWGVEFVGEDCICFDDEQEARDYFNSLSEDDIYRDSEGIELFRVINEAGDTEIIDSISIYDEDEEVDEGYIKKDLKEATAKKSSLTEKFMSIHEKPSTRFNKNLKKVYEMLDKYGTEKEDVDKAFNRATLKERIEMVKLLKEGSETEGKTVVQLSIAQEEPYYDCGDLCGIYEEDVILPDSKVDAFIADLTKYCKKIKSGAIYDEVEDWDIYDCFEDDLYDICEKHGAKEYSKKKGDKVSIETFEYDLY